MTNRRIRCRAAEIESSSYPSQTPPKTMENRRRLLLLHITPVKRSAFWKEKSALLSLFSQDFLIPNRMILLWIHFLGLGFVQKDSSFYFDGFVNDPLQGKSNSVFLLVSWVSSIHTQTEQIQFMGPSFPDSFVFDPDEEVDINWIDDNSRSPFLYMLYLNQMKRWI